MDVLLIPFEDEWALVVELTSGLDLFVPEGTPTRGGYK
jgi:hypothetical protein